MTIRRFIAIGALIAASSTAHGFPDGAPWGAADPANQNTCSSCHHDVEAIDPSSAIKISGLPDQAQPSTRYPLTVTVRTTAATAGFQLVAFVDRGSAGLFTSNDASIEIDAAQARSTVPVSLTDNTAVWQLVWTTPSDRVPVSLFLAAVSANNDASPFGDQPHYRRYRLIPATDR
ncbi:MAG: choice-of-anchor V domain-containing protein [Pseudomonadota bacterium]